MRETEALDNWLGDDDNENNTTKEPSLRNRVQQLVQVGAGGMVAIRNNSKMAKAKSLLEGDNDIRKFAIRSSIDEAESTCGTFFRNMIAGKGLRIIPEVSALLVHSLTLKTFSNMCEDVEERAQLHG